MKKWFSSRIALLLFLFSVAAFLPACKVKEGCPTTQYTNRMDKKSKGGKSQLFPKSMSRKMKN